MAKIFYSYSHEDEDLRNQLAKHLENLKRSGEIETWHDREIEAGTELDSAIQRQLEEADIILLLVSSDFLASPYIQDVELKRALQRHRERSAVVIPVILRPCDWQNSDLGLLMATPRDGRPITSFENRDEAFLQVVQDLRRSLRKRAESEDSDSSPHSKDFVASSRIRNRESSFDPLHGLRIRKDFSDLDRDEFLHEAFEVTAHLFESSLKKLEQAEPSIRSRYQRIDANRFAARIYIDGEERASCTIRLGSPFSSKGIAYSDGSAFHSDNSCNETLTIDDSKSELHLQSLMGGIYSGKTTEGMTSRDAAEHLWSMFTAGLK